MAWHGIEGHDEIRDLFRRIVASGRLAHAYLFLGPEGIGKRRFALLLSQALQCEHRPAEELDPCEECSSCRQIKAGTHPDVTVATRPEDRIEFPIETVRSEIIRPLSMKPTQGRYRIVIADEANTFNEYSANALLKTLEEPPQRSLLILLSTSPELLLPTILSRCQQIWFKPLSPEVISRILVEQGAVSDVETARYFAELAEGSVSEALLLVSPQVQKLRAALVGAFGAPRLDAARLLEVAEQAIELAGSDTASRRQMVQVLCRLTVSLLRMALRLAVGNGGLPPIFGKAEQAAIESLARTVGPDRLIRMIDRTLLAGYHNDRKAHVPFLLEAWACALADLAFPPPLTSAARR